MTQIKNLLDDDFAPSRNILLVGSPGTQKTIACSMLPQPILWFSCDYGPDRGFPPFVITHLKQNSDNVIVPVRGTPYNALKTYLKSHHNRETKSIVIDPIGYFQKHLLEEIMTHGIGKMKTKPTYDEWGQLIERTWEFLATVCDMGLNVCVTGHQLADKEMITESMIGLPHVIGTKLPYDLPGMFSTVLHLESTPRASGPPSIKARSTPTHIWSFCKDVTGILDATEEHPIAWTRKMFGDECAIPEGYRAPQPKKGTSS